MCLAASAAAAQGGLCAVGLVGSPGPPCALKACCKRLVTHQPLRSSAAWRLCCSMSCTQRTCYSIKRVTFLPNSLTLLCWHMPHTPCCTVLSLPPTPSVLHRAVSCCTVGCRSTAACPPLLHCVRSSAMPAASAPPACCSWWRVSSGRCRCLRSTHSGQGGPGPTGPTVTRGDCCHGRLRPVQFDGVCHL